MMRFIRHATRLSLPALSLLLGSPAALLVAQAEPTVDQTYAAPAEAQRLPSGLITLVLQEGTGEVRPQLMDRVIAHYTGRSMKGEVFMDSYEAGRPGVFDLRRVFPGWQEGLLLMVEGEKRRLWIPPELGSLSAQQGPTNETVVFDVELLSILSDPAPPADLTSPPEDVQRTPSGSQFRVLTAGAGTERSKADDGLLLKWVGWGPDGVVFDSTDRRGNATIFPLDKMPPALADCVRDMVVGESRRCWIAASQSEGIWAGAPKGDLVFDLELVRIIDASQLFGSQQPPS